MDIDRLIQNAHLMKAVRAGDLPEAEKLLSTGADVNFVNLHGKSQSPLHDAVEAGNPEMVKLLLSKEANCEAKNVDSKKPLDLRSLLDHERRQAIEAVFKEHFKRVKSTQRPGKKQPPTAAAASSGTYMKRSGTAAVGQLYETKLLTMVLFRLLHDDEVESFQLGNNLDEAGAFDDIVLKTVCVGGRTRVHCLQAKHRDAASLVNFSDLVNMERPKGDFHLAKYFDSYLKIRYMFNPSGEHDIFQGEYEQTEMELIIFTPALLNFPEKVHCEYTAIDNTFRTSKHGKTVQIECTQVLLESFVNVSKEWHRKAIAEILVRLILLQKYNTANLSEAIGRLQSENVLQQYKIDNFNSSGIMQLCYHQQMAGRVDAKLLDGTCAILEDMLLPSEEDHVRIVKDFFENLRFYTEQATEDELEDIVRRDIKSRKYESDEAIFFKAHSSVEAWWKRVGQVGYLSKRCKIFELVNDEVQLEKIHSVSLSRIKSSLIKFRTDEVKNPKWIKLFREVRADKHVFMTVCSNTPELSCLKIVQYFQMEGDQFKFLIIDDAEIVLKVLSEVKPEGTILVYLPEHDCAVIEAIRSLVKRLIIISKHDYLGSWASITDETKSLLDLEPQCQEKLLENCVSFQGSLVPLNILMDKAPREFVDARTLQKLVSGENITISNTSFYMDQKEYIGADYIDRILLDNRQHQQIPKTIVEVRERLVIVAAEPGMGKSTLLTGLAASLKKSSPSSWIVRMNLMNYSKQFHQWNKISTDLDVDEALSLLIKAMCCEFGNRTGQADSFERSIFRWYCKQRMVILLIDGFDEISPDYTSVVLQLLKLYKANFSAKLWVTTRAGGVQKELESHLSMTAYSLKPFTVEQAKLLMWNFWNTKLTIRPDQRATFEDYVEKLLTHLSQSIDHGELELISVPLQIKMIAIVFQDNFEEYCNTTDSQPRFEKLDLVSLYERFIDLKFHVILLEEKNNIDVTIPNVKQQSHESFRQFQIKHKHAAMYALFTRADMEKILKEAEREAVQDFLKEIKNSVEMTGIITRIVDGKPVFVHQTYAEFFAAQFIWEKYASLQGENFQTFLESISVGTLIKAEQAQFVKFVLEIAQKKIDQCSNVSIKASLLLSTLLDVSLASVESFNSRAFAFLLGIVECSMFSNSDCFARLKLLVNGKQGTNTDVLLLKAAACGYCWLVRLVTDVNAGKVDASFDWLDDWTALHFAANGGHVSIVEHLLRVPVNVNSKAKKTGRIALHMAIEKKYCTIIDLLVNHGSGVNICTTKTGMTPLHLAAQQGLVETMSVLLERMAKVDSVTADDGETALHIAAGNGNLEVVKLLIKHDADVNIESRKNGSTPLLNATRNAHLEVVRMLLKNGANPSVATSDAGFTALHWSARENLTEIAPLLLDGGASIDVATRFYGQTPLHIAVTYEHVKVVQLLVNRGANVDVGTHGEGLTALHLAARSNFCDIAAMLLAKGAHVDSVVTKDGGTPLHFATESGHLEMVQLLIDGGANVNIADKRTGWTALHVAARNNFKEIANALLENGSDINRGTEKDNTTALDVAIKKNSLEVVRLLLYKDANITTTEWTSLHAAAAGGFLELVELLLEKDIDIDSKWSDSERTPLFEACLHKHTSIVQVLLKKGANVHLGIRERAYTPLHMVAQNSSPEIIKLLVEYGADIDSVTSDMGRTPLYEAAGYKNVNAAKMLLDLGANVHLGSTDAGYTPLHAAAQKDCSEIIRLLFDKGANIHCTTSDEGITPLFEAASFGSINAVRILLDLGANVNLHTFHDYGTLHRAAENDHTEIIKMLLDSGANVDGLCKDGKTPLIVAVQKKAVNAVKTLLDLGGASVDGGNADHKALHCAAHSDCPEIIQMLINAGADINCTTSDDGLTPLYMACQFKALNAVKTLLHLGANVHLGTISFGFKPLHCAAMKDSPEIIKLLVQHGANINGTSTKHSRTPLLSASEHKAVNAVKMLLALGANVQLGIVEFSFTPLHAAAQVNCPEIVKRLVEKGAHINCTDNSGLTPLGVATSYNSVVSVKMLVDLGANVNPGAKLPRVDQTLG